MELNGETFDVQGLHHTYLCKHPNSGEGKILVAETISHNTFNPEDHDLFRLVSQCNTHLLFERKMSTSNKTTAPILLCSRSGDEDKNFHA